MRRAFLAFLTVLLLVPSSAQAEFGLKELDVVFTNSDGSIANKAGSHPFAFTTTLGVNTFTTPDGEVPEGEIKDLDVIQMPGLVGSQTAVPKCPSDDFNTRIEGRPQCSDETAVGIVAAKTEFDVLPAGFDEYLHVPLYNLEPGPGEAAKLGFVALNVPIVISVGVNPDPPYNLVARLRDVPQSILFYGSKVTIWGNPASPLHDSLRGECVGDIVVMTKEPVSLGNCPVDGPEAPFLTLPRACTGSLATVFTAASWQDPDLFTPPQSALTQGMAECEELEFAPTVQAKPTASETESPSGLELTVQVEDEGLSSAAGTAQSDVRAVKLTLPEGVTANPSAAEGQGACTPADFARESLAVFGCPESATLGTLQVKTPLLEKGLEGTLYLAEPRQNPFGTLLALYMVIRDPQNGILIKLPVKVEADPSTGRLVSTVEDLPQLPFSEFKLRFRKGPRAPLTTPARCGTYAAEAVLTPWSGGAPLPATSTFEVNTGPGGAPCPTGTPPFVPGFQGGSIDNQAGAFSPFYMRLLRSDGEQEMTRFDSVLPPGVTGKLAGVERCSDLVLAAAEQRSGQAELAAPSCPSGSQVGRVVIGAGVGSALTWATGKIYLAGPFGGAPLSVAVVTPAVAGPFDLGTVVVREALNLNPTTAEVEVDGAASEPIPRILEGIPLKLRDLRVFVDRENFTLNPTSCEPSLARATLFGSAGSAALLSERYQAANCEGLGFKPRLWLKMSGGTKRSGHPSLKAVLTPRKGNANIGRAQVRLPRIHFIDQDHISNPCTRVQFNANQCPPGSVLGTARAFTPLLDQPLEGPVYFRSNGGERKLPDIVADLKGQFRVILVGFVDSKKGGVRTTFASPPDAPVSKFVLTLKGGKEGLLVNSGDLCARTRRANVKLGGQNGKLRYFRQVIKNDCTKKGKGQKRRVG